MPGKVGGSEGAARESMARTAFVIGLAVTPQIASASFFLDATIAPGTWTALF